MVKRVFVFLIGVFLFSGTAFALEFSADTITTHKDGQKMSGKIYYKADKFRMDMKSPQDMSTIMRRDKSVTWSVMHQQKMYMEMPFQKKDKPMVEGKLEGEVERKQVGTEVIDGHPTKKYLVTYKSGTTQSQIYQWMATDINFPVKTAAVDGSWTQEYKNIRMGSQPDNLFEVPAGYKKMQMPQMPGRR